MVRELLRNKKGYSLVEMIVVLLILGLLILLIRFHIHFLLPFYQCNLCNSPVSHKPEKSLCLIAS